jgi:hypothetical protein
VSHKDDLRDLEIMTGSQSLPVEFEAEYMRWLRLQHRRNKPGALGDLLIPLLRKFDIGPPDEASRERDPTNWRQVQKGQRLLVKLETGGQAKATFIALGSFGTIELAIDGDKWVQNFPAHCVSLDHSAPADVTVKPLELVPADEPVQELIDDAPAAPELPQFDITQHGIDQEDEEDAPLDEPVEPGKRWKNVAPGRLLKVRQDGQTRDASFIRLDGLQIIAQVDGEETLDIFDDSDVTIPRLIKAKKGRKKKAAVA